MLSTDSTQYNSPRSRVLVFELILPASVYGYGSFSNQFNYLPTGRVTLVYKSPERQQYECAAHVCCTRHRALTSPAWSILILTEMSYEIFNHFGTRRATTKVIHQRVPAPFLYLFPRFSLILSHNENRIHFTNNVRINWVTCDAVYFDATIAEDNKKKGKNTQDNVAGALLQTF